MTTELVFTIIEQHSWITTCELVKRTKLRNLTRKALRVILNELLGDKRIIEIPAASGAGKLYAARDKIEQKKNSLSTAQLTSLPWITFPRSANGCRRIAEQLKSLEVISEDELFITSLIEYLQVLAVKIQANSVSSKSPE